MNNKAYPAEGRRGEDGEQEADHESGLRSAFRSAPRKHNSAVLLALACFMVPLSH